jgi:hypothetical protein
LRGDDVSKYKQPTKKEHREIADLIKNIDGLVLDLLRMTEKHYPIHHIANRKGNLTSDRVSDWRSVLDDQWFSEGHNREGEGDRSPYYGGDWSRPGDEDGSDGREIATR